jgi:hypothetical protein
MRKKIILKIRIPIGQLLVGFFVLALGLLASSCGEKKKSERAEEIKSIEVPPFNSDSAYTFVERQVEFGPRIPNTEAHKRAGDFFINSFRNYGAEVTVQEFEVPSIDGPRLKLRNIIASFFPENQKRIMLAAHWDTRPYADKDEEDPYAQFQGANDGASGVAVLLEIARQFGGNPAPAVGVDLILFDGEDWGEREDEENQIPPPEGFEKWWCMGSQYWGKNKHQRNYHAFYGIVVDMVGARNAKFFKEGSSREFAPRIVDKVWNTAARLGYSDYFVSQHAHAITDDHYFVNKLAKIPTIDIVHYQPGIGYFGDFHHTQKDNISLISKETLGAVGNTLLNVIYYED